MKSDLSPVTYSVREAARLLGVSPKTIRAAIYRGEIASLRVGRRLLVPRACIEAMLKTQGASNAR